MIHLVFLGGCFVATILMHTLLLNRLSCTKQWKEKRRWHLVALSLPGIVLSFFSLGMLPDLLTLQAYTSGQKNWEQYLLAGALVLPLLLLFLTFALNVVRTFYLYMRVVRFSWEAPAYLEGSETGDAATNFSVRLWYHVRPFAFTLPALWPGMKAVIILSTSLVERLDSEEVHAVLWHEKGHLCRNDFWITWLATWWRDAFFYLPSSWAILQTLREGQEERCDAWVATVRGKHTALALASALLKIWEDLLQGGRQSIQIAPQAPGLASDMKPSLTEQRVILLIKQAQEQGGDEAEGKGFTYWNTTPALVAIVLVWFSTLATIHFLLLSFGCDLSFPMR